MKSKRAKDNHVRDWVRWEYMNEGVNDKKKDLTKLLVGDEDEKWQGKLDILGLLRMDNAPCRFGKRGG